MTSAYHYFFDELTKLSDHVNDRAMERTNLSHDEVEDYRERVRRVRGLKKGQTYHVHIPGRGYIVVGDVGDKRKKHVAKTVLSPTMKPPGTPINIS